jgi:hypothetical protein
MFKGPASILTSSPNFAKFTSFASDIDLKAQAKMPQRIPRMIWWNLGNLNVEREDGTAVLLGSEIAAQKWEASPAKILAASTTATILYVWW